MTQNKTSRRLTTDAKIVLERAGYKIDDYDTTLYVDYNCMSCGAHRSAGNLTVEGGTVDNAAVVALLEERGYNAHGYKN